MSENISCGLTASFLDSGRVLANAGNAAAVVAGIGCIMAGPAGSRCVLAGSLLVWFVESWFAVRVAIDSSLFRVLAADPAEGGRQLDAMLSRSAAVPQPPDAARSGPEATPLGTATARERPLEDRSHGALKFWRRQTSALAIQLAAFAAGIVLRIANF